MFCLLFEVRILMIQEVNLPLVSVIMPTYNRKYIIKDAIDSCLIQSYKNIEIIICDDHSTDGTKEYIEERMKEDARIKYCVTPEKKKGANAARNTAIKMSKGKYIVFLDTDDYLMQDSILKRVELFSKYNVGMVYGNMLCESSQSNRKSKAFFTDIKAENLNQKKYLMQELSLCSQITIMVKASVFQKIGLLDEQQKAWTDDGLVVAVGMHYPILHSGEFVAVARISEGSMISNKWNSYLGCKILVKKYKKQIIQYASFWRYLLWQIRLFSLYCYARETSEDFESLKRKVWQTFHILIRKVIWPFFRNHFE